MAEQKQALLAERIKVSTEQITAAGRITPYHSVTKLTQGLARELIKRIVIKPNGGVQIEWNFSDELSGMIDFPEISAKKQAV